MSSQQQREPWRNAERHYCAICNAWMGSDRQSILIHENGKKHIEKLKETLKQRQQNKHKRRPDWVEAGIFGEIFIFFHSLFQNNNIIGIIFAWVGCNHSYILRICVFTSFDVEISHLLGEHLSSWNEFHIGTKEKGNNFELES